MDPGDALEDGQALLDLGLGQLDLCASRFRPDSELCRINRDAGRPQRVSRLMAELLQVALEAARSSDGLTDPTLGLPLIEAGYSQDFDAMPKSIRGPQTEPPAGWGWQGVRLLGDVVELPPGVQLDLGASAKAWAADRAAQQIASQLECSVLVSLGGDLSTAGPPRSGGWVVRVGDSHKDSAGPGQTVRLGAPALATSSTTQRRWVKGGRQMNHLIDPRTGRPVLSPWRTVSVAGASCLDANTASTAAIVAGADAPRWLADRGVAARLVSQEGRVLHVGGWPSEGDDMPLLRPLSSLMPAAR
jgi:thiamine biosynthesis lipoprotein